MLDRRDDGRVEARCDRCLVSSPIVAVDQELADLGWEFRSDRQTWCLACSLEARTPLGPPNARGVARRRRSR